MVLRKTAHLGRFLVRCIFGGKNYHHLTIIIANRDSFHLNND